MHPFEKIMRIIYSVSDMEVTKVDLKVKYRMRKVVVQCLRSDDLINTHQLG